MELTAAEIGCLRRIAQNLHSELTPCADPVLHHLMVLGLIERRPRLYAPLEWSGSVYRITHAGERALRNGRS